jgi:hypothetical protein
VRGEKWSIAKGIQFCPPHQPQDDDGGHSECIGVELADVPLACVLAATCLALTNVSGGWRIQPPMGTGRPLMKPPFV